MIVFFLFSLLITGFLWLVSDAKFSPVVLKTMKHIAGIVNIVCLLAFMVLHVVLGINEEIFLRYVAGLLVLWGVNQEFFWQMEKSFEAFIVNDVEKANFCVKIMTDTEVFGFLDFNDSEFKCFARYQGSSKDFRRKSDLRIYAVFDKRMRVSDIFVY